MAKHVYHWKHGWIPLDHVAALSKAKGNHKAASKILEAVHQKHLSREKHITVGHRDGRVAIHDTKSGHIASIEAHHARELHEGGKHITGVNKDGSLSFRGEPSGGGLSRVDASGVREGDVIHEPSIMSGGVRRLRVDKAYSPKSDGSVNVDVTDLGTGRTHQLTLPNKPHNVERHNAPEPKAPAPKTARKAAPKPADLPEGYSVRRDVIDQYGPVSTFSAYGPGGARVARSVRTEAEARRAVEKHHAREQSREAARQDMLAAVKREREAKEAQLAQNKAEGAAAAAKLDEVDIAHQVETNHMVERMHNAPGAMSPPELARIASADHVSEPNRKRAQDELNRQAFRRVQSMPGHDDERTLHARLTDARHMPDGPIKVALIDALERTLQAMTHGPEADARRPRPRDAKMAALHDIAAGNDTLPGRSHATVAALHEADAIAPVFGPGPARWKLTEYGRNLVEGR
ncbi:hypothetical protein GCM10027053_51810 [Intrasporangium mesophilum]